MWTADPVRLAKERRLRGQTRLPDLAIPCMPVHVPPMALKFADEMLRGVPRSIALAGKPTATSLGAATTSLRSHVEFEAISRIQQLED